MPKYMVKFEGFAYVEADSPEAAEDAYDYDAIYEEREVTSVHEVEAFVVDVTGVRDL